MYHEVTYREERLRRHRMIAVVAIVVLFLVVVAWAVALGKARIREIGARSLHETISSLAMRSYAIDGVYPSTLAEIEARYDLTVRHDLYRVSYEWLGDNMPPSVVVMPRD